MVRLARRQESEDRREAMGMGEEESREGAVRRREGEEYREEEGKEQPRREEGRALTCRAVVGTFQEAEEGFCNTDRA